MLRLFPPTRCTHGWVLPLLQWSPMWPGFVADVARACCRCGPGLPIFAVAHSSSRAVDSTCCALLQRLAATDCCAFATVCRTVALTVALTAPLTAPLLRRLMHLRVARACWHCCRSSQASRCISARSSSSHLSARSLSSSTSSHLCCGSRSLPASSRWLLTITTFDDYIDY